MPQIDALATERHFIDHLAPVWKALDPELRGNFFVPRNLAAHAVVRGVEPMLANHDADHSKRHILVASYGDYRRTRTRRVILMEHGAGQTYPVPHTSYAGGPARERVGLFLCPNKRVATLNARAWPDAKVAVIGSPRLDPWRDYVTLNEEPVIAIAFHWDCKVAPESRSAWSYYYPMLHMLARAFPGRAIGHAHPRLFDTVRPALRKMGFEPVRDFDEVLERADVFGVDNSSTLFEFAATGRPVVVLNQPMYRKTVNLWPRFWWGADVGVQVNSASDLVRGFREALEDKPARRSARDKIVSEIFPHAGQASKRAAWAIKEYIGCF